MLKSTGKSVGHLLLLLPSFLRTFSSVHGKLLNLKSNYLDQVSFIRIQQAKPTQNSKQSKEDQDSIKGWLLCGVGKSHIQPSSS